MVITNRTKDEKVKLNITLQNSQASNGSSGGKSEEKSQLYWAKGTGFGTGSTQQSWNVEQALVRQRTEEEHVTVLLQVTGQNQYLKPILPYNVSIRTWITTTCSYFMYVCSYFNQYALYTYILTNVALVALCHIKLVGRVSRYDKWACNTKVYDICITIGLVFTKKWNILQ